MCATDWVGWDVVDGEPVWADRNEVVIEFSDQACIDDALIFAEGGDEEWAVACGVDIDAAVGDEDQVASDGGVGESEWLYGE
ncbi:MAG TPA: hypothetical protein DF699_12410 [Phycisphaerales bacterium]|nr:hypothetical protein [Phycisphaerales bacterium]